MNQWQKLASTVGLAELVPVRCEGLIAALSATQVNASETTADCFQ